MMVGPMVVWAGLATIGCRSADVATAPAEAAARGEAAIGAMAPDFTLTDLDGETHTLSALKGKTVVLEWFNPGCPFVKHAHGEGGVLASTPGRAKAGGAVWLAINSGAPGKQGHGVEANRAAVGEWKLDYPVLVDESGEIGRAYGAMTTPHMYIVDPEGKLVYRGAIDNRPLGKGRGTEVNYVDKALADLGAGRAVATSETKPYGCSVKY